jgi:hypothetical protein
VAVVVNTVEAVLRSRYVDGVSDAVAKSKNILQTSMDSMVSASASFSRLITANLLSIGIAVGIAGAAVVSTAKALAGYLFERVKESAEIANLRSAYDALTQSTGWNADTLQRLQQVTKGAVESKVLLMNVNRAMQGNIRMTSDEYVRLTGNVVRLSKAMGVDAKEGIKILNDALIKGTMEGFERLGVSMIAAKDHVTRYSDAAKGKLSEAAKAAETNRQVIAAIESAARRLPAQFESVADSSARLNNLWTDLWSVVGQGVLRSRVLVDTLNAVADKLGQAAAQKDGIDSIARATNQAIVSLLGLAGAVLGAIAIIAGIGGVAKSTLDFVFNLVPFLVGGAVTVVAQFFEWILRGFSALPGSVGRFFSDIADKVNVFAVRTKATTEKLGSQAVNAFSGALSGFNAANEAATKVANLAKAMDKLTGEVIKGSGAAGTNAAATAKMAVNQKELNEQLNRYLALRAEIARRDQTGLQKAAGDFADTLKKIRDLDLSAVAGAEAKKGELRALATKRFLQEVQKLNIEAAEKQRQLDLQGEDIRRDLQEQSAKANAESIQRLFETISGEAARKEAQRWNEFWEDVKRKRLEDFDQLIQQGQEYLSLIESTERSVEAGIISREEALRLEAEAFAAARARLEELRNQAIAVNLPADQLQKLQEYERQVAEMQNRMRRMTVEIFTDLDTRFQGFFSVAADGWVNFWKDLASGQEGSGKKLLAVFVGWIGKLLVQWGMMLMQAGLGEIALATTLFGKLMGASVANGAKLLVIGAAIAAAGGILQGAASNLAQTNQAGSSGSSFQNVPRPNNNNPVQVIRVGRPEDEGRPAAARDLGTLKIDVPQGFVVKHVRDNIRANGELRTIMASA